MHKKLGPLISFVQISSKCKPISHSKLALFQPRNYPNLMIKNLNILLWFLFQPQPLRCELDGFEITHTQDTKITQNFSKLNSDVVFICFPETQIQIDFMFQIVAV